jgi:hypothetical protein
MNTKVFSAILATAILSFSAPSYSSDYNDVPENHWAYKSLKKLADKYDFKLGYPDGTFRGNKTLSRYEVASLLVQLLEKLDKSKLNTEEVLEINKIEGDYSNDIEKVKNNLAMKIQGMEDQLDMLDSSTGKNTADMEAFMKSMPFTIFGDIWMRYSILTKDFSKDLNNQTPEMRLDINLESKNINPIGYGIRIASGSVNRTTNLWWKFSDFYGRVPLNIDRFFITYRPEKFFEMKIGRFKDVFANSQILLEDEISPQGAIQTLKFSDMNSFFKEFSLTAGEMIINMDSTFGNTYSLNALGDIKLNFTDFVGLNLRGSFYNYMNANNIAQAGKVATDKKLDQRMTGNENNNSLETNGNYKNDFNLANGFGKLIFRLHDNFPLVLSADYIYNTSAQKDNIAYDLGLKLGSIKEAGNFMLGYNYKHLEKDATVSYFVEQEIGGTDFNVHEASASIKLFPSTILSANLWAKQRLSKENDPFSYILRVKLGQSF